MRFRLRPILVLLIIVIIWSTINSQNPYYFKKIFTTKDGLTHNYIVDICEDDQGFLWIATRRGISQFDGSSFNVIDSLRSAEIWDIFHDTITSKIWISTSQKGLIKLDPFNKTFEQYFHDPSDSTSLKSDFHHRVTMRDNLGNLWHGYGVYGLSLINNEGKVLKDFIFNDKDKNTRNLNSVTNILPVHSDSTLWIITLGGVIKFNTISEEYLVFKNTDIVQKNQFWQSEIKDETIYLGTYSQGAWTFDISTEQFDFISLLSEERSEDNPNPEVVRNIFKDDLDDVFISRGNQCIKMEESKPTFFLSSSNKVTINHRDQWNRYYGMLNGGLAIFDPYINQQEIIYELPKVSDKIEVVVNDIFPINDEEVLIAAYGSPGIYHINLNSNKIDIIPPSEGLGAHGYYHGSAIAKTQEGKYIIASDAYFYTWEKGQPNLKKLPLKVWDKSIPRFKSITVDNNGSIWAGSRIGGLVNFDMEFGYQVFEKIDNNKDSEKLTWIEDLFCDSGNNLWIRKGSGYSIYNIDQEEGSDINYTKGNENSYYSIKDFDEDTLGRVWVLGEHGLGLTNPKNLKSGVIKNYDKNFHPELTFMVEMTRDDKGCFWILKADGVIFFNPYNAEIKFYHSRLGVGGYRIEHIDKGTFAFYKWERIFIADLSSLATTDEVPKPYVKSIIVNNLPVEVNKGSRSIFSHNQNNISITHGVQSYFIPDIDRVEYRLLGLEDIWHTHISNEIITYNNLKPGSYSYEVRASNTINQITGTSAYEIKIKNPWWQTWWFRLLVLSIILGLIYLIYMINIKSIKREQAIETRISQLQLKALQSQMNPHFVFNCLNTVDGYIATNEREKASAYLGSFSRLIRRSLQYSRKELVSLLKELELITNYVELERVRMENPFTYHLEIKNGSLVKDLRIPPLLIQPYVENAIRHGLSGKGKDGLLTISDELKADRYYLSIIDNGKGIVTDKVVFSELKSSLGMQITQERIDNFNKIHNMDVEVT
ncbi:MAG: histidine kinase, partial [Saprospiraceae bacterium]|nr:histidine kinase [Saprospiraceae bacterium]